MHYFEFLLVYSQICTCFFRESSKDRKNWGYEPIPTYIMVCSHIGLYKPVIPLIRSGSSASQCCPFWWALLCSCVPNMPCYRRRRMGWHGEMFSRLSCRRIAVLAWFTRPMMPPDGLTTWFSLWFNWFFGFLFAFTEPFYPWTLLFHCV